MDEIEEAVVRAISRSMPYCRGGPPAGWQQATWDYACEPLARAAIAAHLTALEAAGFEVVKKQEPQKPLHDILQGRRVWTV